MKKLIMGYGFLALCASLPAGAALPGGVNYWAASADTVGSPFHTGIVVTDSTYAACVAQFSNAMASHASAHGDSFTNIQNCHYVSSSHGGVSEAHQELHYVGGVAPPIPHDVQLAIEAKFIQDMSSLEEEHQITEFISKRNALVEKYVKKLSVRKAAQR